MDDSYQPANNPANSGRRDFFKKACAFVLGGIAAGVPIGAGLMVYIDPLRHQGEASRDVHVTNLDALPADGVPRKFSIVANRSDAWNKYPQAPIGAIYLRRVSDNEIEALNVVCPHAGCFVDYMPAQKEFFCPCHNSAFALDGRIKDPKSPSPRPMDSLKVEVRNGKEVWVAFQNFQAGTPVKKPIA